MRAVVLHLRSLYFKLKFGIRFQTHGNVKIGKNVTVIFSNKSGVVKIGSNVTIGANTVFHCDGKQISIGDSTEIDHNTVLRTWGGEINVGSNVYINSGCVLDGHGKLEIGDNCLIGMQVAIVPSAHITNDVTVNMNKQGVKIQPVFIDENVWIGSGAKILGGARINKGAIIGSNAVVKKDVPDNTIALGIPANKFINR